MNGSLHSLSMTVQQRTQERYDVHFHIVMNDGGSSGSGSAG